MKIGNGQVVDNLFPGKLFCLLMKNAIKYRNFWFPKKLYEIRKEFVGQNCLSQEDIQTYLRAFYDRTRSFCFNRKKC